MRDDDLTPALRQSDGKFAKGYSGNKSGKAISAHNFARRCRTYAPRMLELAVKIAENEEHPKQMEAIKFVVERAHGKPPEQIDMKVETQTTWAVLALQAQRVIDQNTPVVDAEVVDA
jgi:Flp pilus assembly CpaF family ATPase